MTDFSNSLCWFFGICSRRRGRLEASAMPVLIPPLLPLSSRQHALGYVKLGERSYHFRTPRGWIALMISGIVVWSYIHRVGARSEAVITCRIQSVEMDVLAETTRWGCSGGSASWRRAACGGCWVDHRCYAVWALGERVEYEAAKGFIRERSIEWAE